MTLKSFVAVDTETTGLDFEHDRMIELAAVRFEDGKPVAEFEALFDPGRPLSPVSRLITGLTPEQLEAAPPAADSLRAFLEFAGDLPLVAHNAEFDAHFVRRTLEAESLPPLPGVWIDSLLLSRVAWPASESHRLDSLAAMLDLARDAEHRALPDARRCGLMFLNAVESLGVVSPEGRRRLAGLAADLPDWKHVFADETSEGRDGNENAGVVSASALSSLSAGEAPAFAPEVDARAAELVADALGREAWLAVETPRGLDETATALEAAARAAAKGQRVLLCVPDNFAWNGVRKSRIFSEPSASHVKLSALSEPSAYLNRARLSALLEHPERLPLDERAALLPLVAWADRGAGSLMADGRGFSPERARLAASRVQCDAYGEDPGAKAARSAAESAGVILVTHATLCAHLKLEGALLPACDSLVVVGAHRLPESAQRALGREVTFSRLRAALQLARFSPENEAGLWPALAASPAEGARVELTEWAEKWFEPERQFQKFLQKAGRHAAKRRPPGDSRVRYSEPAALAFGADPAPVLDALRESEAFLEARIEARAAAEPALAGELRRVLERLRGFRVDFERLCDARDAEEVYWFEDVSNPHKASLRSAPRDPEAVGARLRELFGAGAFLSPALLTGARGGEDASYFARALGLATGEASLRGKRAAPASVAEPASPAPDAEAPGAGASSASPSGARFLMAPFAPGFSATEPPETFARFLVEAAAPFIAQGVLVFFPSQGALRTVHGALKTVLPVDAPCWAQHVDGNRDAVLRLFASGRGGLVLATEGMPGLKDADGRAPALFAITRMPLPPAHDPLLEARGEVVRELGRNARAELWYPAAVLRVKREWSSLHRGGPASGPRAVWLLDARASAEGLGAQAARALGADPETAADVAALQAKTREALG